ncbi:hypothetical protein [Wohlfahrtiimonas larvae]|uniref:Uncharacterized protein n=1 Tax=Wohlfahrtiimonas larvae TaxID=1157986 RepID=A0ABP9MXT4_9GAMM|nr:hypothetical protein [Wohlfahrtiimonas larvae]
MLKAIGKGINIIWEYFSTLFLCGIILFLTLNVYIFSYVFVLLLIISSITWLFTAIFKKDKRKTSLIRLGIYVLVFCVFYGYGQYLQIKQIETRENVVNLIRQYEQEHGKYPEREFINGINTEYSKYQMRFIYYLLPAKIPENEPLMTQVYQLSYRTMLLTPFDDVIYRGNNNWEIFYD